MRMMLKTMDSGTRLLWEVGLMPDSFIWDKLAADAAPCACGQTHPRTTRTIRMRSGAVADLAEVVGQAAPAGPIMVVSDRRTYRVAGAAAVDLLRQAGLKAVPHVIPSEHPHAREGDIAPVTAAAFDMAALVSVGAGSVTDITRMAAHRAGRPFVAVPTAASMDGYASNVVPMFKDGIKLPYPATPPVAVVVDLDLIATAPAEMTRAGYGDMIGKLTARVEWMMANRLTGEPFCADLADLPIIALRRAESIPGLASAAPEALAPLMEGLLLSGIAIQMAGSSRPAAGGEHHIGHYWEELALAAGEEPILHGDSVGLGSVFETALIKRLAAVDSGEFRARLAGKDPPLAVERWDEAREILSRLTPAPEEIRAALLRAGAPGSPRDLGLTRDQSIAAIRRGHERRARFTALFLAHLLGLASDWAPEIVDQYY